MSDIKVYCVGADEGGRALILISVLEALLETHKPQLRGEVKLFLRCLSAEHLTSSSNLVAAMTAADYKLANLQGRQISQKDVKAADVILCSDAHVSEFIRGQFYVPHKTMLEPAMNFAPAWKGLKLPRVSKMSTEECDKFIRMVEMASMGILNTLQLKARSNAVKSW